MSKWILVKDKLPENRVGKIVYCEDGSVTMMYYDPEKGYWVSQMGFDCYDVLAWMEKPKPPSGLTPLAVDCAYCHCSTTIVRDGVHCVNCGRVYKSHSH